MSPAATADVNYWFDKRCARAFWSQSEIAPYRQLLADTAAWVAPSDAQHWLDLGCGSGKLTRMLWEKSHGRLARIVALDCAAANVDSIAAIRRSFDPPIPESRMVFQHGDFSGGLASFADDSFHGAVSGLAIQYAQHWSAEEGRWTTAAYDHLLADVRRILRPGCRFVFSVNVPDPSWLRIAVAAVPAFFSVRKPLKFFRNGMRMMRYGKWLKQEADRGRFHYLDSDTIHAKLEAAGFVDVEHRLSYARQAYLFRARKPA